MEPEITRARLKGCAVPGIFTGESRGKVPGEKLPKPQTQREAGEKPLLLGLPLENVLGRLFGAGGDCGVAVLAAEAPRGEELGINTPGQGKGEGLGG